MHELVLLRHGESVWNKKDIFTGWIDIGLSRQGKKEARQAGKLLKEQGFVFDLAFTSVLKRAAKTTTLVLKVMGLKIPVKKSQALNERHYGLLQGKNKKEILQKYGPDNFLKWRRSWAQRPPALKKPAKKGQPKTESLQDVWKRIWPYWEKEIALAIKQGKKVLISTHGSTCRALVKHLSSLSDQKIEQVNIPTGIPLVYELDQNLRPIRHYYLGETEQVAKAIKKVSDQGQ